ncbi:hypothetical protein VTI28DRAFT_8838 [Corynascus sepedonium]
MEDEARPFFSRLGPPLGPSWASGELRGSNGRASTGGCGQSPSGRHDDFRVTNATPFCFGQCGMLCPMCPRRAHPGSDNGSRGMRGVFQSPTVSDPLPQSANSGKREQKATATEVEQWMVRFSLPSTRGAGSRNIEERSLVLQIPACSGSVVSSSRCSVAVPVGGIPI